MSFSSMGLAEPVLTAVRKAGYTSPTPIQQQAIPVVLNGSDVFGCAQTGTGKTAAFALPILTRLYQSKPRRGTITTLVLAPTRELAAQIATSFRTYSFGQKLTTLEVFGGVSINNQQRMLRRGVDILVATPGRLIDLMEQRMLTLNNVTTLVLDEADRMMDMGFMPQVKQILKAVPQQRQTLFFSATVPNEIVQLASTILHNPVHISVTPPSTAQPTIAQERFRVEKEHKRELLAYLLDKRLTESVLVFTRTKHGADKVAHDLVRRDIRADAIHGNKTQAAREKALANFRNGKTRVLVATDIAARGLDIQQLPYVVNFDIPESAETYVHRIGRTGRAGKEGTALLFCTPDEDSAVRAIEKQLGKSIELISEQPYHVVVQPKAEHVKKSHPQKQSRTSPDGKTRPSKSRRSKSGQQSKRGGSAKEAQAARKNGAPASGHKATTTPSKSKPVYLSAILQ